MCWWLQPSGRPSTSIDDQNINNIKEMVLGNRRLTIRELFDMVGISFGSVQTILKDNLCLRRVKSRLVPKFLKFFEKERRVQACEAMLSDYQGVFSRLKRSNVKRYEYWKIYLQTTFRPASKTGGNVGTSALVSGVLFWGGRYRFGRINKDYSFYNEIHLTFRSQ